MKHTNSNSNLDGNFVRSQPRSTSHSVAEALRQGNSAIRFAKVRFQPYEVAAPVKTGDPSKVLFEKVAGLSGCRAACAVNESKTRRIQLDRVEPVTGETETIRFYLKTNTVFVLSYGKVFQFSMTNRSKAILDSRDGSRRPVAWVKAELRRLLGCTEGDSQFAALTAFA